MSARVVHCAAFPGSHRLTRAEQYAAIRAHGQRHSGPEFVVLSLPNSLSHARLGLAISVKAAGNAVARNRLKRICRESFRRAQHHLGGWDVVVMARPGAATQTSAVLLQALDRHWRRIAARAKVPVSISLERL
ncbi:MAG TPA: ribonuclease P protein component [Candidatus Acidoferrales bacterium]|nr:ribonuclease P protein component [Candidatus Acidoferrales bacterium]